MVLKDLYRIDKNDLHQKSQYQSLAHPSDRLLASLLDFLFHFPFFSLVCFIILHRLNLLKLTVATTTEIMAVVAQLIWVVTIGTVILKSIYLKFWNKTPGMKIMKLELRSKNKSTLSWEQCLLRSSFWTLEVLCLGLPLLAILSHPRRQSFHDRIAETEVISLKDYGSLTPMPAEKAIVSLVTFAILMLGLGWMTAFFSMTQKGIQRGTFALSDWREQGQLCSQVDEISTYSNIDISNLASRLDFSIGLFLLEQIDSQCLNKEVDFSFYKQINEPLIWVGRTLLSPINSPERTGYSNKACKADSRWCLKALFNEKTNLSEVLDYLKNEKKRDDSLISYDASKLLLFNKLGASQLSKKMIISLQEKGLRATGLVAEHLKIISREKPEELTTALNTLQSVMVEKDFLKLNSEACLRQLEVGCLNRVSECESMNSIIPRYKNESLNELIIARAKLKDSLCKNNLEANMEYWTLINNKSLQKLIQLSFDVKNDATESQALVNLRSFVKDNSVLDELRFDALQVLMEHSNYSKDWDLVSTFWQQQHWSQSNYLSLSAWVMREAKKFKQDQIILSMESVASKLPGLSLDWNLLQPDKGKLRLPASIKGK